MNVTRTLPSPEKNAAFPGSRNGGSEISRKFHHKRESCFPAARKLAPSGETTAHDLTLSGLVTWTDCFVCKSHTRNPAATVSTSTRRSSLIAADKKPGRFLLSCS